MRPRLRFNEDVSWWAWFTVRLTCNWFATGWHCWRKGHEWRAESPSRCVSVSVCAYCGKYRGARRTAATCQWAAR